VLQITLHITTMDYAIHHIGMHYSTAMELAVDHDAEFKPTFLNTVVFILQLLQQSCIFLFNHPGEPHMQRLDVKSKFFKALVPIRSTIRLSL
jgi:magnesium-transporting ATPase (P-type)